MIDPITYRINALPAELRRKHERAYDVLKELSGRDEVRFGGRDWDLFSKYMDRMEGLMAAMEKDVGEVAKPIRAVQERQFQVARDAKRLEDVLTDIGYEHQTLPHDDTQCMYVRDNGETLDVLLDHDLLTGTNNTITLYQIPHQDVCEWYKKVTEEVKRYDVLCARWNKYALKAMLPPVIGGGLSILYSHNFLHESAGVLAGVALVFGTFGVGFIAKHLVLAKEPLRNEHILGTEEDQYAHLLAAVQSTMYIRARFEDAKMDVPEEHELDVSEEKKLKARTASIK